MIEAEKGASSRRTFRRSLQARVLAMHALGLVTAVALTLGGVNLLLQLRTRLIEHRVLEDQATGIIQGLSLDANGRFQIDYAATTLSRNGHNAFAFMVRDAAGQVQLSSENAPLARLLLLDATSGPRFLVLRDDDVLSTVIRPFDLGTHTFWIVVAWNLSAPDVIFDNILDGFLTYSAAVSSALLVLLLAIDAIVMRRSLRPLLRVVQAVRLSHRTDDDYRMSLDELPYEILPMARAYNDALDQAEAAYRMQREFTADAAHELRTPLAVLQARIETLAASGPRRRLLADVTVMSRIVGQLLQIASLEQPTPGHDGSADPVAVCEQVVEALAPVAVAAGRDLGLDVPAGARPPNLRIRRDELFQLLRNLVENAIHHTRPGVCIDVTVRADGTLIVSDDGPGIPPELHAKVFERFWRRDRQARVGAGLGLAIVQRLVATHGGTVGLDSAPEKGCRFQVRLPVAS